ncbi:MAG: rod shape-determining protein MreC [Kiritimatiellaeota bacterium]|nr:rod shape-determining protein MreC [Kiritimatiellota bacterium]
MRDRTLINIIVLGAILLLVLNLPLPLASRLKALTRDAVAPLQKVVADASRKAGESLNLLRGVGGLIEENRKQAEEVARLRIRVNDLQALEAENLQLREQLRFRRKDARDLTACGVIGRDVSGWWSTLRLDKGAQDGLQTDMAVITSDGLIGRLASVSARTSDALLISDPNCRISALVERSGAFGIVSGRGPVIQGLPTCRMEFIDKGRKNPVAEGDEVISSGLGGVFPHGLPIGKLEHVQTNASGLYLEADVVLRADLGALDNVFVVADRVRPPAPANPPHTTEAWTP